MLTLIGADWRRRRGRTALVLLGALVISLGMGYLIGLAETSKGTVTELLEKRWANSYDILVRSPEAVSPLEDVDHIVEPNFLSTVRGGITIDQWHRIQAIPGVKVAAPVAMLGYLQTWGWPEVPFSDWQPGVYRLRYKKQYSDGVKTHEVEWSEYYTWDFPALNLPADHETWDQFRKDYGVSSDLQRPANMDASPKNAFYLLGASQFELLVVAVDPAAEDALVGLKGATAGQYLDEFPQDRSDIQRERRTPLPLLVSTAAPTNVEIAATLERLAIPTNENGRDQIKAGGGKTYLDQAQGQVVARHSLTPAELRDLIPLPVDTDRIRAEHQKIVDASPEEVVYAVHWTDTTEIHLDRGPIGPLRYQRASTSPFPDRWSFVYQVQPTGVQPQNPDPEQPAFTTQFRGSAGREPGPAVQKSHVFRVVGTFDSARLMMAKDPLTELPLETYRPASALLRLDPEGQPVNPPKELQPSPDPRGLLTSPPVYLTNMKAAALLGGEKPISAIRIRVYGSETLSEQSQQNLEKVAEAIRAETGLRADIMAGSSPRRMLVQVLGYEGDLEYGETRKPVSVPGLGYVEQPWALKGASIGIYRETRLGFSTLVAAVMLVAVTYVLATSFVSVYSRRRELALLLVTGWRPVDVLKLIMLEGTMVGAAVAAGAVILSLFGESPWWKLLLAALLTLLVYLVGALLPGLAAARLQPWAVIRAGEVQGRQRGYGPRRWATVLPLLMGNLMAKRRRYLLSLTAMAFPTGLLLVFGFVTLRLKGELYLSWLGEYVTLEVGPVHYFAAVLCLVIALITTADVVWLNVLERRSELALLHALGWKPRAVLRLVVLEGAMIGLVAGICGYALGLGGLALLYGPPPLDFSLLGLAVLAVPTLTGTFGALLPGLIAGRVRPSLLLRTE